MQIRHNMSNGRHITNKMVSSVHLTTQQQLQQLQHPSFSSRDGWMMVGVAACIAGRCCCCCSSTLPSTTPCTAVCTATALPSSFSSTTPVVSISSITALPLSSITTRRSTCLAIPTSLYSQKHMTLCTPNCLLKTVITRPSSSVLQNHEQTVK